MCKVAFCRGSNPQPLVQVLHYPLHHRTLARNVENALHPSDKTSLSFFASIWLPCQILTSVWMAFTTAMVMQSVIIMYPLYWIWPFLAVLAKWASLVTGPSAKVGVLLVVKNSPAIDSCTWWRLGGMDKHTTMQLLPSWLINKIDLWSSYWLATILDKSTTLHFHNFSDSA